MGGMLIQQSFNLFTGIVIGHAVGAAGYGLSNILRNIITALLTLTPVGLDLALLKYGPHFASRRIFCQQLGRLRLVVVTVNITAVLIGWGLLGGWLQDSVYHTPGFRTLLLISLAGLLLAADLALLNAAYRVENRPARFALMSTWLQAPIRFGGAVLTLWFHWSVMAIIVSGTLAYAVSLLCAGLDWTFITRTTGEGREVNEEKPIPVRPEFADTDTASWGYILTILNDSYWMALSLFAYGALRFVDILVLGAYAPKPVVGSYGVLSTVSQLVAVYPLAMSQTLGPNISRHYLANDLPGVKRVLNTYIRSASLAGGFVFGGIVGFGDHLDLIFGHSFHFEPALTLMLPLGWFVSATLAPTGYSLSMTGHHKAELMVLFMGTCVLTGGCFLLVPGWGALGAATAVLIAFLTIDVSRFAMVSRHLGFFPGHLLDLLPPLLAAVLAYGVKHVIDQALPRTFLVLVLGCTIYALIFGGAALRLAKRRTADRQVL